MKGAKECCALLAVFAALGVRADVLEVGPGKTYTDIATAIGAANDYDTVLVYDGTYEITAQIEVTKPITVKSANGVDVTRVVRPDGHGVTDRSKQVTVETGARRVLYINNPEARVEGIAFCGGAVWNVANEYGGGVLIGADGGTLANCTVTNNFCRKPSYGGGIAVTGAAGLVTNCLVSSNYNYRWSSGDDYGRGAGVYMTDGNVVDSTLTGNGTYAVYGAGAYLTGGRMSRCRITGNKAGSGNFKYGGGIYLDGASALVDNCLIAANTSAGDGGGAYVNVGTLANCTIVGNTGAAGGGVWASASGKVYNCILSGNKVTADTGAGAPEWCGASATYRYCLSPVAFPSGSTGCQKVDDPCFVDAARGDYSLSPESDAIDAGLADVPGVTQTLDLARANRFCNRIDIGCYEYQYSGVLVSITQSGDDQTTRAAMTLTVKAKVETADALAYRWNFGDGWSDWSESNSRTHRFGTTGEQTFSVQVRVGSEELAPSAGKAFVYPEKIRVELDGSGDFADVPSALAVAGNGTVVQVGAGQFDFGGMLVIDKAIRLEGAGAERTVLHRTDGAAVAGQANRVLLINHDKAVVRGVAVTGGYVYGATGEYGGGVQIGVRGGLLCDSIVSNNSCRTASYGAGVALLGNLSVVSNCLIAANVGRRFSSSDGETSAGGVYLVNGLVTHCVITNNACGGNGAGVYIANGRLTHSRVIFNRSTDGAWCSGAGVYIDGSGSADNVLVFGNKTGLTWGSCLGGVYLNRGTLLNCTVVSNTNAKSGAGVYIGGAGGRIFNTVIEGNSLADDVSCATTNWFAAGGVTFGHSMCPETLPSGDGNVQASAVYADPERYVLKARTAGWKAGTTVGYESTLVGGTDLWDTPRVRRVNRKGVALVDMGCAESAWEGNGFCVIVQ